jgi:integrase
MVEYTPPGGRKVKVVRSVRQLITQFGGLQTVPDTEAGSRPFWLTWWKAKRAELDTACRETPPPKLPMEEIASAVLGTHDLYALPPDVDGVPQQRTSENVRAIIQACMGEIVEQYLLPGKPLPMSLAAILPPDRLKQLEDAGRELRGTPAAPTDLTVQSAAELWTAHLLTETRMGKIAPATYDAYRHHLRPFIAYSRDTPVRGLEAGTFMGFYDLCRSRVVKWREGGEGWSPATAGAYVSIVKIFLRWCIDSGWVTDKVIPRRRLSFGSSLREPPTWDTGTIETFLACATPRVRLFVLLALNCGFTQTDIATLKNTDIRDGYIVRRRQKGAGYPNAPVTSWRLWDRTSALLDHCRAPGRLALLNCAGQPLLGHGEHRSDGVYQPFRRCVATVRVQQGLAVPRFKDLRKTSASKLKEHPVYRGLREHFLGHTPTSIADRFYAGESQPLFDSAVLWLGQQLGIVKDA